MVHQGWSATALRLFLLGDCVNKEQCSSLAIVQNYLTSTHKHHVGQGYGLSNYWVNIMFNLSVDPNQFNLVLKKWLYSNQCFKFAHAIPKLIVFASYVHHQMASNWLRMIKFFSVFFLFQYLQIMFFHLISGRWSGKMLSVKRSIINRLLAPNSTCFTQEDWHCGGGHNRAVSTGGYKHHFK